MKGRGPLIAKKTSGAEAPNKHPHREEIDEALSPTSLP